MSRHAFGDLIRKGRRTKGMSLRAFAAAIGYSAPYISDVENGHRKALADEVLPTIATLLGVSLRDLTLAAAASRQGGFLLPYREDRHNEVAYTLFEKWEHLQPEQLEAIHAAINSNPSSGGKGIATSERTPGSARGARAATKRGPKSGRA